MEAIVKHLRATVEGFDAMSTEDKWLRLSLFMQNRNNIPLLLANIGNINTFDHQLSNVHNAAVESGLGVCDVVRFNGDRLEVAIAISDGKPVFYGSPAEPAKVCPTCGQRIKEWDHRAQMYAVSALIEDGKAGLMGSENRSMDVTQDPTAMYDLESRN